MRRIKSFVASTLFLGAFSGSALAANYDWVPKGPAEQQLNRLSEEDKRRVMDDIIQMQKLAEGALKTPEGKRTAEWTTAVKRRMDQLASEEAEGGKKRMMESVGLPADEPSGLFYLVSWSMPIELLRAYVLEAHWAGGSLVFRGIPPDKRLIEHVMQDYVKLSRKEVGLDAPVNIDPRMFDMFGANAVPAVVLVDDMNNLECVTNAPTAFKSSLSGKTLQIKKCEAPKDSWWKVTGGVTTGYALQLMAQAGSKTAAYRLEKFKSAASGKKMPPPPTDGKSIQPYAGAWDIAFDEKELAKGMADYQKEKAKQKRKTTP